VVLLAAAGAIFLSRRPEPARAGVLRFSVYPQRKAKDVAVSPDGRQLVFSAPGDERNTLLWMHSFDAFGEQPLAGTEGAAYPFWSPDSRSVAFFAGGKLKRITLSSVGTQTLCDAASGKGGTWGIDGTIVFAAGATLFRVSAAGGVPQPAVGSDVASSHVVVRAPYFLPDGHHFLYSVIGNPEIGGIFIGSLDSKAIKRLAAGDSPVYAAGNLLFVQDSALMLQPFDPIRLSFAGEARRIPFADHVRTFSTSEAGVLAYQNIEDGKSTLVIIDRSGKRLQDIADDNDVMQFSLSPDARTLALSRRGDIWLSDLSRGATTRITFAMAGYSFPVWSPDSSRIVFLSNRSGAGGLYQKRANGEMEQLILNTRNIDVESVDDWSGDGRFIIYTARDRSGKSNLWALPVDGERKPFPIQSSSNARQGRLSPDARWLAYVSDESGEDEVYVEAFPGRESRWQVSTRGGDSPRWRRDGRELFYISPDRKLARVSVSAAAAALQLGAPQILLDMPVGDSYDIAPDGRFLVLSQEEGPPSVPINIVINWNVEALLK
jgi:Tol biopolymer transport system component